MATTKPKVLASQFLDWYFSDDEDKYIFAKDVIADLKATGSYSRTVEDIFECCEYIPGFITDIDDDEDYEPSQCILTNDLKTKYGKT